MIKNSAKQPDLAALDAIIGRRRLVRATSRLDRVEQQREHDAHCKIDHERLKRCVAGHGQAVDCQRENGRLETERGSHPGTCDKTRCPACDKRPRIKPARIETDDDRGNGLANPDAAKQLELYRILERQKNNEQQGTELHN